jgi:fructose-1,6-bisphosphatase/inositol monophosphatase family enzyme
MADDLTLAAELVRAAGDLAATMRTDGLAVARKTSVTDVVSAADHAAEELIVARLRAERPADAIVGEEGTSHPGSGRTWYLDPVDGTYNFVSGLPFWCTALALVDAAGGAGDPVLGAVYDPNAGELWLGGRAAPATCNGTPLAPLADRSLADVSLSTYLHPATLPDETLREPLLRAMRGAATVRMMGCGSVEFAAVAAGRLGAWFHANPPPWDWLPGAALVLAAGGAARVVETGGNRWHIAGPHRVVDELTALALG